MPVRTKLQRLRDHQAALAEFGTFAFRSTDLQAILYKASSVCATSLDTAYCKVCRFRPERNDLLIVAGFGWMADVVGKAVSPADASSPGGRAFSTGEPVICSDLAASEGFVLPNFYAQHGIVSTANVVIQGSDNGEGLYGILEIDSTAVRSYDQDEINFLRMLANMLAEAIATAQRVGQLRAAVHEKDVLGRELQHRVRNNLHLISSMLTTEAKSVPDLERSFRTIANRVQTLATIYDHLLGTGMARELEFDKYLATLCENLSSFQPGNVTLRSGHSASVVIDLDIATAMGLAVTELITNSYNHAFPQGEGNIEVAVERRGQTTVIRVQDDGVGIPATKTSSRHGLGLVQRLVEQIEASIHISNTQPGVRYEIELPPPA